MITFTIKYFSVNSIKKYSSYASMLIIYLVINALFVIKYGVRQSAINIYLLIFGYLIITIGSLFLIKYFEDFINRLKKFNWIFLSVCGLIFIGFIAVNYIIDGNTLNTDRWSALEVTVKSALNFEYPYNVKDHLGKTTSNLPGLFYLGLPFYLIGNIGLLQAFVFGLLIFLVYKLKYKNTEKLFFLTLLLLSPAYLWEVIAKSDLMSNIFLLLFFMFLWDFKNKKDYFKNRYLLSFLSAFFVLTRAIVAIPLTLFLFKKFVKTSCNNKLKFSLGFLISMILISLPVLISLPEYEVMVEHNPFNHQTRVGPKYLQYFFLIVPFYYSFYVLKMKDVLKYSFKILTTLLFLILAYYVFKFGFYKAVTMSYFDISYLGMILPFLIFYFIESLHIKGLTIRK